MLEMARAIDERRTTATTRRSPQQRGQWRTSVPKVRRSSSAQGMGRRDLRGEDGGGGEATSSVEVERSEDGGAGTRLGRSRALGAKTPKYRTRLALGGGTRAARRRRKASGERTRWVCPEREGRFIR